MTKFDDDDVFSYSSVTFQVCRVTGKNSGPCEELKINGTDVIEIPTDPITDNTILCDCVGILKAWLNILPGLRKENRRFEPLKMTIYRSIIILIIP